MKNFISTNKKDARFRSSLPIGPKKIVQQENNNIHGEILVLLFCCFLNSFPGK